MGVALVNEIGRAFGKRFSLDSLTGAPTIHQFALLVDRVVPSLQEEHKLDPQTIARDIRTFITENYPSASDRVLHDDDSLLEHGVIDETNLLALATFLEEKYGFEIGDNDLTPENMDSISGAATLVTRALCGKNSPASMPLEKVSS